MKNTFLTIVALVGIQLGSQSAMAMDIGLTCTNIEGEKIEVTPLDAKSLNVNLISNSGSVIDDNNYIITGTRKTPSGSLVLVAVDKVSKVTIQILGLDSENVGQLQVVYTNHLMGYKATFQNCDIVQ